jgi:protein involved in polysaccharide export with SLBB domain
MNVRVLTGISRSSMRIAIVVTILAVISAGWGCGDNPPLIYPTTAPFDPGKLVLGPGDKIELTIFHGQHETKTAYSLDSGGQMEVRYIGTVAAAGKTAKTVQQEIQDRLADGYLNDPVVSLTVVEINSLKLAVLGQVVRSGSVKFTPGMTIVEAIAQSGGFTPLARKNLVRVTRLIEGKKETYKIPVEMIAEGKRPNFPMAPGDEVFVPERPW